MPTHTFRELNDIPKNVDDVLWPDLDSVFYRRCSEGLQALTSVCEASSQRQMSFYVGAGISVYKPSRLPVAYAVIKSLFEECVSISIPT